MAPVAWVGRWKFLDGWTKVWNCERHADELPWAGLPLNNTYCPSGPSQTYF